MAFYHAVIELALNVSVPIHIIAGEKSTVNERTQSAEEGLQRPNSLCRKTTSEIQTRSFLPPQNRCFPFSAFRQRKFWYNHSPPFQNDFCFGIFVISRTCRQLQLENGEKPAVFSNGEFPRETGEKRSKNGLFRLLREKNTEERRIHATAVVYGS